MKKRLQKTLVSWMFLGTAAFFRLLPAARGLLLLCFRFRIGKVARILAEIPAEQRKNCVLFLSPEPHSRELRLAAAARAAGWLPVLVQAGKLNAKGYPSAQVGNYFDVLLASWFFQGPLVHIFGLGGAQVYLLCATKTRPTILDLYDTCADVRAQPRAWLHCEREAIRLADGITHRDLRIQYLKKHHKYALPKHNILIHDLLEDHPILRRQPRGDGEVRVVSSGRVGKGDNSVLRVTKALCAHGIHLHMYVNPYQSHAHKEVEEYLKLAKESDCFHLEQPVSGETWREHLRRYDFGLSVCEPILFGEAPHAFTLDSLVGCGSSRLMDYLQAGLGVIISPGLKFQWMLARHYVPLTVAATPEFLKNPRPILEAAMQSKVNARQKNISAITAAGAAPRLGRFYERVASEKTNPVKLA